MLWDDEPKDECEPTSDEDCPVCKVPLRQMLTECGHYEEGVKCRQCNRQWWHDVPVPARPSVPWPFEPKSSAKS